MNKINHRMVVRVLAVMAVAAIILPLAACPEENDNETETKCTVTFDTDGGDPADIASIRVIKGKSMDNQFPNSPSKEGYFFGGWYEGSNLYTKNTPVEKDVNLKVRWNNQPELVRRTAVNPLLKGGDFPDPAVTRVGDAYYMVSTTMYFCPVAPIMKSYDLINWKIVSYCADIIDDLPNFRLETEDANRIGDYGRGQWASSIRHYNGKFWVIFRNNTTGKSYVYSTVNADTGPWERKELSRGFHDPCIFQDDDGKMYIFYGYTDLSITEMLPDLSDVKSGGIDRIIIPQAQAPGGGTGAEGSHVYKINGYYYWFICTWALGSKTQHVYRATDIEGPWTERRLLQSNSLGGKAVAQGGIVDTPDGDWYAFLFKEPNASGRVPTLVPMRWEDDWPVLGATSGSPVPTSFSIKQALDYEQNMYVSDEFDDTKLQLAWQWNHNPDNDNWSLTEKPGYLRLRTGRTSKTIYHARNTLTQRVFETSCSGSAAMETTSMKDGDKAGLMILQGLSGFVCVEQEGAQKYIAMYTGDNDSSANRGQNATVTLRGTRVAFDADKVYFNINCTFRGNTSGAETAVFQYSLDGTSWTTIGNTLNMSWTTQHFTGARFGLFNYATKEAGGYVDFDYFHVQ